LCVKSLTRKTKGASIYESEIGSDFLIQNK
jgi:hypothetical protein